MQIIKFNGGIGNQLFQYAFYKYCQINGIKASADISVYKKEDVHGGGSYYMRWSQRTQSLKQKRM